ncbi:hypothetical protein MIC97_22545 [Aquamicrobium sp. NLF2-7]|uniref:hypothetical protein n=1 Tax=Aquamicrobium sp. NLF2-7 TaxID=2918753 RepID=UPI001EFADAB2|nr:hypothetical protein [Aquamicrobium sp. NLF2-7]MCG8274265.1 hypothetical protein [Aquamicrobium sp. NLF2-7]
MTARPLSHSIASGVAVVFGLATVISGGRALFGGVDMGATVPFVLWFNFVAGFAYLLAGTGLWRGTAWAPALSIIIAATTAVVFAFFLWHVWRGGAYENRTMAAMTLRLGVWIAIATVSIKARRP